GRPWRGARRPRLWAASTTTPTSSRSGRACTALTRRRSSWRSSWGRRSPATSVTSAGSTCSAPTRPPATFPRSRPTTRSSNPAARRPRPDRTAPAGAAARAGATARRGRDGRDGRGRGASEKGDAVPEGHTIHRLAEDYAAAFAGRGPLRVTSPQGKFSDAAALLDRSPLHTADAHGKHLFLGFRDPGPGHTDWVHIHLGLFGKVAFGPAPAPPPTDTVRLRLAGDRGYA